ncbi:uncharacterized protein C20orf96-like [Watersipora subatra]|uniref:uncharacterized protein C20orf96-like n=1 Tax=Watersipora subatra TaxID=2589382 RepID=UPI00355C0719
MAQKKTVQLSVAEPVDDKFYSQWERRRTSRADTTALTSQYTRPPSTPVTGRQRKLRREEMKAPRYVGAAVQSDDEHKSERIKLLELKVLSATAAIANHKERERVLLRKNLAAKNHIQEMEKPNHESVKKLMRRYEKFRGGISFLSDNFTTTLQTEVTSLDKLEKRLKRELDAIQSVVDDLDRRLQEKQSHVYILNNYKDKEYPVKAIRIGELMTELDKVEMENNDDYYDLERVVDEELEKLTIAGKETEANIKESALNEVLTQMHPSLKDKALQNQVMEKEIKYHKEQIIALQNDIIELEGSVRELIAHPKTNVRLQVFPELFKYETKCTPEMDVILDIPKVKLLPI